MSDAADGDIDAGILGSGVTVSVPLRNSSLAHVWFSEAINKHNMTLLAMISAFFSWR